MVARATRKTCGHNRGPAGWRALVLLAGVLLATPAARGQGTPPPTAPTFRYARASSALTAAIDLQRRGELEQAQVLFDEVQLRAKDLTPTEQQEFIRLQQVNKGTLATRQQARDLLSQAERAAQQGQSARVQDLLKQVAAIEHALPSYDRSRYDQLRRGAAPVVRTSGTAPSASPSNQDQLARTKLQQARALLSQGNYEGAEQLAREAESLGVAFSAREDRPSRVIDDVRQARSDPKGLLAGSRAALQRGDLDMAQQLADAADKAGSTFTFPIWADTPAKVRKDIQQARKSRGPIEPSQPPRSAKEPSGQAPLDPAADPARKAIAQARQALAEGRLQDAARLSEQARGMNAQLAWWEDNPEKLRADLERLQARGPATPPKGPAVQTSAKPVEVTPATAQEAPVLLRQARDLVAAGQIDEAERLVERARTAGNAKYGLFDHTPDKVMNEVLKARRKRDQAEADRLLVQARKLYEQGNYAEAKMLAFKAQSLHGPYDLWHLGDQPEKLLQDVRTAEARTRPTATPPPVPTGPISPPEGTATAPKVPVAPVAPVASASKQQVLQLMAEVRTLQSRGELIQARQKALEAHKLKVPFSVNEESPEAMLLQLTALAQRRSQQLMQKATVAMSYAQTKPQMLTVAEQELRQARELTAGFGLDTTAIDQKLSQVTVARMQPPPGDAQQVAAKGPALPLPVPVPGPTHDRNDPMVRQGLMLLEQSLMELRRGDTRAARIKAEQAYESQFKVKELAAARLREIDTEEFNQRKLESRRAFDAGVAAFNRREYAAAKAILASINPNELKDRNGAGARLVRYRELMASPELGMAPTAVATGPTVAPQGPAGGGLVQASEPPKTGSPTEPGRATASDGPGEDALAATKAMQSVLFQKVRTDSLQVQQEANDRFRAGEMQAAIEMIQDFMLKLPESQLDREQLALIKRPLESRVQRFKLMKSQDEYYKQDTEPSRVAMNSIKSKEANERNKQKNVGELMKQFNTFYKEGKYKEAEMYAMLAHDVDPDNHIVAAAVTMSKMQQGVHNAKNRKKNREDMFMNSLDDAEDEGPAATLKKPLVIDKERHKIYKDRKDLSITEIGGRKSEKVREIEGKLDRPVTLNFNNAPLRQVLDDLRALHGINIVPDTTALEQDNISLERPITVQLEQVSLKSALNILLRQARLTWVIRDEVLQVTTEAHARGKLVQKTYLVADLVIPVENYGLPANPFDPARSRRQQQQQPTVTPFVGGQSMAQGTPVGSATGGQSSFGTAPGGTVVTKTQVQAMQDQLIRLITQSITPGSWTDNGGPGTIDYFPLTMALVVNQTQDIQEQIADLLAALRRLQDQEVAVEVRFISIAEGFYERLGLDFQMKIKTDRETARFEPTLTSGQFKPAGFINDFSPSRFIAGLTPAGTFTSDLDIPIRPNTFNRAIPPFGGFPNMPGDNGGIALGLAFLSDIQVFLFMEAAQGDQRTNVMQAPKLTMFNGQTSSINISNSQNFVTDVQVVQQGGNLAFVPTVENLAQGVSMTVQAVISADRRFVRLSLQPQITNLASAIVPMFPIITPITPIFDGGFQGQPTLFTQFLQQPVFSSVNVQSTVVVPDGGTVVLGGLKRLSEGRNEFGPPVLSKIPYVNRLFKNVGYGRESESLLLMVTPRIIINEEEEIVQTGVISSPQLAQ